MSYRLTEKEMQNVLALPSTERVMHFIKRVADHESAWGLRASDGWVSGDIDGCGKPAFAIWPHPEYASACATGPWSTAKPEIIGLDDLMGEWLPEMSRLGVPVAIFPTPQDAAVTMTAQALSAALAYELENY
ncbi:DUF2750 domain-containing protein [Aeromonas hydrophila]|uniref:DUF2750 domain-containing protein n=1 Tax=Aeromonas hydrophila TaxID=644 RepID=UPI00191FBBE9|nr:DUF2750 domain-containing protein [Aeromonas hydrophila]MBL0669690.1 DUF2750 domain-containing protein [Aeromonas hydrophila]